MGDIFNEVMDKWFNIEPPKEPPPPIADKSAARIAAEREERRKLRRTGGGAIIGSLGIDAPALETQGRGRSPSGMSDILSMLAGGRS